MLMGGGMAGMGAAGAMLGGQTGGPADGLRERFMQAMSPGARPAINIGFQPGMGAGGAAKAGRSVGSGLRPGRAPTMQLGRIGGIMSPLQAHFNYKAQQMGGAPMGEAQGRMMGRGLPY